MNFTRAEAGNICFFSPDEVDEYKNFVIYTLSELNVKEKDSPVWAAKWILQGWWMAMLVSTMSLPDVFINSSFSLFNLVLQKPPQVVRDYKVFLNLDRIIKDRLLEFWFKWKLFQNIEKNKVEYINSQVPDNILFDINFKKNISYLELSIFIWDLNNLYKSAYRKIIIWDTPEVFKQEKFYKFKNNDSNKWNKKVSISMNSDVYDSMQKKYKSLSECPWAWDDFKKNIWKILNLFKNDGLESWTKIESTNQRLMALFGADSSPEAKKNLKQREEEVMKKYRALNDRNQKGWNMFLDNIVLETDLEELDPLVKDMKSLASKIKNYFKDEDWKPLWKTKPYEFSGSLDNSFIKKKYQEQFVNSMRSAWKEVLEMETSNIDKIVKASPAKVTQKFPSLSKAVYKSKRVIGSRERENSIIWLLWKACELQCSNLWGICRYY